MKRITITITAAILILVTAFAFTGCGRNEIEGKWQATGYKINDEIQTFNEAGMSKIDMSITLNKDGSAILTTSGNDEKGAWSKNDDADIEVELNDRKETLVRDDKVLLLGTDAAGYVVFEKAK